MRAPAQPQTLEFCTSDELRRVQQAALTRHLCHAAAHSPYYRHLFAREGADPAAITLNTLASLPLTEKESFARDSESFCATPRERIVDISLSSGTSGRASIIGYTERDLERLALNEELSLGSCGIGPADVVLLTCTLDRCFIAGLAYYLGVRKLGAAAVRSGQGSLAGQAELIGRLKPTVLIGVPSFLLRLGRFLAGTAPRCGVTGLICIGEPIRDRELGLLTVGRELEATWGAQAYSTYASSETVTSFCECSARQGGHLHPELAVLEVVDDRGGLLPPGATGEVVITPLGVEGMPLVRFRTGDVKFLIPEPCSCGRNSPRLGPILGRRHDAMKLKGTTLYPASIYSVLDGLPGVTDYFVRAASRQDLSEQVAVHVAAEAGVSAQWLADQLQAILRVRPEVVLVTPEQVRERLQAGDPRKLNRFFDERDRGPGRN